jgi:hypothetical protein
MRASEDALQQIVVLLVINGFFFFKLIASGILSPIHRFAIIDINDVRR